MPAAARARDRRLVGDEATRLLEACNTSSCPWLAPITILAVETAMRQGELLALTWDTIDLTRRVARLLDTKNGERRDVPLSIAAIAVLTALPRAIDGRVFPISQDNLEGYWRRATKAAEIADLRFHDLRHEAASRLFEKGLNPMEVAAITGHKTLQMLKRYTHLRAEDIAVRIG